MPRVSQKYLLLKNQPQHSLILNILKRVTLVILGILCYVPLMSFQNPNSMQETVYTAVSCPLILTNKPITIVDQSREFIIDYILDNDEYILDYTFSLNDLGYNYNDVIYVGFSILGESPNLADENLVQRKIEDLSFSTPHHIEININELLNNDEAITAWNELLSQKREFLVVSASFYFPNGTISMVYDGIMTLDSFKKRSKTYE